MVPFSWGMIRKDLISRIIVFMRRPDYTFDALCMGRAE